MIELTGWKSGDKYEIDPKCIVNIERIKAAKATIVTVKMPDYPNVTVNYEVKETPEQIATAIQNEVDTCARCGIEPVYQDYAWCVRCRPELTAIKAIQGEDTQ